MRIVIIGTGISGVTCAECLATCRQGAGYSITLLSAAPVIKAVANFQKLSRTMESFEIVERSFDSVHYPNVHIVQAKLSAIDTSDKVVTDSNGRQYPYDKLCLCTGARPNLIEEHNDFILGIRDTESVKDLQKRLGRARRLLVVGNGGIAMELVHEIDFCEVVWAIKDSHIGTSFLDAGASTFFMSDALTRPGGGAGNDTSDDDDSDASAFQVYTPHRLEGRAARKAAAAAAGKESSAQDDGDTQNADRLKYGGVALGPRWQSQVRLHSETQAGESRFAKTVELASVVSSVFSAEAYALFYERNAESYGGDIPAPASRGGVSWPVYIQLSNRKIYGCDVVVSATGVIPNTEMLGPEFALSAEKGVIVDQGMRTNVADVYAAGDCCHVSWSTSPNWFQMRLWTQARQMGAYVARCIDADIRGEETMLDFCFEMFSHITRFFGYKVVLLGRFNAQGMEHGGYEVLLRVTKGQEYIKATVQDGKVQGAILIGETDLEETFENLILNQLDISSFKDTLLDPDVDIEDYFD